MPRAVVRAAQGPGGPRAPFPRTTAPSRTLFLLHGITGNHTGLVSESPIGRWAEERGLAVVMPPGYNAMTAARGTSAASRPWPPCEAAKVAPPRKRSAAKPRASQAGASTAQLEKPGSTTSHKQDVRKTIHSYQAIGITVPRG